MGKKIEDTKDLVEHMGLLFRKVGYSWYDVPYTMIQKKV
jgi:hypothetical protein